MGFERFIALWDVCSDEWYKSHLFDDSNKEPIVVINNPVSTGLIAYGIPLALNPQTLLHTNRHSIERRQTLLPFPPIRPILLSGFQPNPITFLRLPHSLLKHLIDD
jgi:hypothetical protein